MCLHRHAFPSVCDWEACLIIFWQLHTVWINSCMPRQQKWGNEFITCPRFNWFESVKIVLEWSWETHWHQVKVESREMTFETKFNCDVRHDVIYWCLTRSSVYFGQKIHESGTKDKHLIQIEHLNVRHGVNNWSVAQTIRHHSPVEKDIWCLPVHEVKWSPWSYWRGTSNDTPTWSPLWRHQWRQK